MWGSFKTTLAGLGVGILNLYANGMSIKNAALSVGFAFLGAVAKDFNISGSNPKL